MPSKWIAAALALAWSVPAVSQAMLLTLPGTPSGEQIEVASVQWRGTAPPAGPRGLIAVAPRPRAPGSGDIAIKGSTIGQNATVAPGVQRGESIEFLYFEHDVRTAREAGSGLAEGKRASTPPATGELIVMLKQPWPGCTVGARFDGVRLASSEASYQLDGVEIMRCAAQVATFRYARVSPQ